MVPFVAAPKKLRYRTARLVKKLGAAGAARHLTNEGTKVSASSAAAWAKEYGVTLKRGRRPAVKA